MANQLVSYSGSSRADVDFTAARKVQFKTWQKAANKAVKAKEEKPAKPDNLRADTLFLIPGSTAFVTPEELDVIQKDRKDVARYLQVHKCPEVPRSLRPKEKKQAKPEASGEGSGENKPETPKKPKRAPKPK